MKFQDETDSLQRKQPEYIALHMLIGGFVGLHQLTIYIYNYV